MINAVVMSVLLAAALTWFTITMRRKIRVMLKDSLLSAGIKYQPAFGP